MIPGVLWGEMLQEPLFLALRPPVPPGTGVFYLHTLSLTPDTALPL